MPHDAPSPEDLHILLRCDFGTGTLFWKARSPKLFTNCTRDPIEACNAWNSQHQDKVAGVLKRTGYISIRIFGREYSSHRVIFAMFYGEWPKQEIDHINGERSDNRITNLRDVCAGENRKNMRMSSLNTSGHSGITKHKASGRWMARIRNNYRRIHLGYFDKKEDAIAAREKAEVKFNFHKNHGRKMETQK